MKFSYAIPALVASVLLAHPAGDALAKAPLLAIEVSGGGLDRPLRITDPDIIASFNFWNGPCCGAGAESARRDEAPPQGAFVDWPRGAVGARPAGLARYEIAFVIAEQPAPDGRYVVTYEFNPAADGGYFYLPRRLDGPRGVANTGMVYHGVEGRWFHSTPAWESLVRPLMQARAD